MRKIILAFLILAVLVSGGIYFLSRRAPEFLRHAIERSINKTVKIESIEYRFPWKFELSGFKILETREPFLNEVCFAADKVRLDVSPLSLSRSRLILDVVAVDQALIVIRNRNGKWFHALSDAMRAGEAPPSASGTQSPSAAGTQLPLTIRHFHLGQSRFQFIDYDVQEEGFVVQFDQIEANILNATFPLTSVRTQYDLSARLAQGRSQKPAAFRLSGWTVFSDHDTDALFRVEDLSMAYFKPYYTQVTPAEIEDGWLSARAALRVHDQLLTTNMDLELSGLYFRSYEEGEQLFGLKAEEILSFLSAGGGSAFGGKDSAGRLKFQIVLQWDIGDRGLEKRAVIRRAIEQSLKKTLLGNVGNILEKTIKKFSDSGLDPSEKDDWEDTLQKVKKLLR